jgi:hypothetical protein
LPSAGSCFDDLVESIVARAAKPVNAIDPAEVEHKKIVAERQKQFGGNGKQRY